ncbi:MAG: cadmium-translocating P-type ATPase [Clostridia bacterium]|nr:cadmium-translocating P-type ATPase [Clostridia bacterium]
MNRKQKKNLIRILVAAVLTVAAILVPHDLLPPLWGIDLVRLVTFLVPYLVVGWDVLRGALSNIFAARFLDEKFLMAIATVGAFALGEYIEGVAVMLLFQVGELFESIAVGRSRKSIAALMNIRPDTATVLRDGEWVHLSPEEVAVGEAILILPGERIPLDGTVTEGESEMNTAALTGESVPRAVGIGDAVVSGAVNVSGRLTVLVRAPYAESTVSKILAMVESASERKSRVEGVITRFARWYTPVVVGFAAFLAILPPIFVGDFASWLERALVFLVVSCPCALVISVPLSFFSGIGGASRRGILIKGAEYLELLASVHTVAFDKTGTLTEGRFRVVEICPTEGKTEEELLALAATAESGSNHPLATAILEAALPTVMPDRLQEHAGRGIEAWIGDTRILVGNARLLRENDISFIPSEANGTVLYISENECYGGYLVLADTPKSDAYEAIASLRSLGIERTVMLTGDRPAIGKAVARELGLDEVKSELLPNDKVSEFEKLLSGRLGTAYVGDGINDAPVLSRADVGIAMGALGSDAAIEAADVVLMDDHLSSLPTVVRHARRTMRIVRQNIVFAIGVKLTVLVLTTIGYGNMWIAIFADVGVLVLAILNAMRAARVK